MTRHLTVRMAWHDNGWNGRVCKEPEKNHYCVGSKSLLSERLKRKRNLEIESNHAGKKLDELGDYIPPCFWTSNAFSDQPINIWHEHGLPQYEQTHRIKETLSGYSVFTWPYKLSFTHSEQQWKRHGNYSPTMEKDIKKFVKEFSSGEAIIFFYLNYDNPISADENKYALVGCATLKQMTADKRFDFDDIDLEKIRKKNNMQNFTTLNWAINTSYDFVDNGVLLPYHEYLEHVRQNPDDFDLLDEMKILIDEEYMIPNFKYVALDIDSDSCIYLLARLEKSLRIIKEHQIVDSKRIDRQLSIVRSLLDRTWKLRGLYPGLGNVLDVIADVDEEDYGMGDAIVDLVKKNIDLENLLDKVFPIITNGGIPSYLDAYKSRILDIRVNMDSDKQPILKKLALFSLTHVQIKNILKQNFKSKAESDNIESNPYLLCEDYSPVTAGWNEPFVPDKKIGTFVIDIGMFPDARFLERDERLQNLAPKAPQRLRAIIRDHLRFLESRGDCYDTLDKIYHMIEEFPLFYKKELSLNKDDLTSDTYQNHFKGKLKVVENNGEHYFYLNEVHYAERLIKDVVLTLLEREDHPLDISVDKYLKDESKKIKIEIPDFDLEQFVSERKRAIHGALAKSIYVITGKAGSGKTQALDKIIQEIKAKGESVTLLAPTGKASLRLRAIDENAKTIDSKIYSEKYGDMLVDFENITSQKHYRPSLIKNIVIDESSMVDLKKLAVLFKMLTHKNGKQWEKGEQIWANRIILVGDENQLPPIGYGKPFSDIIRFIRNSGYLESNFVALKSNCRQRFDDQIKIAEIFRDGNRYGEEVLEQIETGECKYEGFQVIKWKNEDDLYPKLESCMNQLFEEYTPNDPKLQPSERLNLLFGLDKDGHVADVGSMRLNKFQILSPYRGDYFGTLGLNDNITYKYRPDHWLDFKIYRRIPFTHSDKIISTENQYRWNISNGSIGVVNNVEKPYPHREFYFTDLAGPLKKIESELYDLAYAITIHKSQGSEFENTFVVLPQKLALLSRELVYTALTRSTGKITLFLQTGKDVNVLEYARRHSAISRMHTSIFTLPEKHGLVYEPEPDVFVRSKVEYILFKELKHHKIDFKYEHPHIFRTGNKEIKLRPDFTVTVNGKEFFLEHLGMLDREDYYKKWMRRRKIYEENDLVEQLITTDDIKGIREEMIIQLVGDIAKGSLRETKGNNLSLHHYELS